MPFPLMLRAGLLALLVSFVVFLALPAHADDSDDRPPAMISMTGTGTVNAVPDMAVITSGVVSEGKSAREALSANTAAMTKVVATLKEAGIEPRDIATSDFSVNPVYSHYRPKPGEEAKPPKVVGYRVSNAVTIRVRDLDKLGSVLDQVVSDGANAVNGIHFVVDDDEAMLDQARKDAVADAIRKATILTQAAGVKLGPIVSINENGGSRPPAPVMRMARAEAAMAAPVPMQAGEQTLQITVSVTWELVQ